MASSRGKNPKDPLHDWQSNIGVLCQVVLDVSAEEKENIVKKHMTTNLLVMLEDLDEDNSGDLSQVCQASLDIFFYQLGFAQGVITCSVQRDQCIVPAGALEFCCMFLWIFFQA